jgi:homoserine dehydrogenase
LRLALIGFGNVGKAFARLLVAKRPVFPFRIVGITTALHGAAFDDRGLPPEPEFGPPVSSIEEFLDRAHAEVVIEITTLNPATGEPAISHIRAAFARRCHVATANKGPIAHAYPALKAEADRAGVCFRFESTVMDGAPVFNMVRNCLPGVVIEGFTGVLNSTSKIAIDAMREGLTMEEGIRRAQQLGVAEADASFDIDGWDSAAKGAALANVLMDAGITPLDVDRRGIGRLTTDRVLDLMRQEKTVALITRAKRSAGRVRVRVRAEVLHATDVLTSVKGTSNLLLLHTDLMGTVGTVSLSPRVEQTAYGVFSDVVDIARTV